MEIIAPDTPWQQAKDELWKDCGFMGQPGTKEKERNIYRAIMEEGIEIK